MAYFAHDTTCIEEGAVIGEGTKIWHNAQVQNGAVIGSNCVIGHNCFVGRRARLGNGVKLESNIDVWDLVTLDDYVFVGPSAVFTNDLNPRARFPKLQYPEYGKWLPTHIKNDASIGANATIVCGITIGTAAMIGAGAVVTKDVPDYAIIIGIPGKINGWICVCGRRLSFSENESLCAACTRRYKALSDTAVVCVS